MQRPKYMSWQKRLYHEYKDLDDRLDKLIKMQMSWGFGDLDFEPKTPKYLFDRQIEVMREYRDILKARAHIEGITLEEV